MDRAVLRGQKLSPFKLRKNNVISFLGAKMVLYRLNFAIKRNFDFLFFLCFISIIYINFSSFVVLAVLASHTFASDG